MSGDPKLDLHRIVFIGRTFAEYMAMFNLSTAELAGRSVLDCPAGACSFAAYANRLGADVTVADRAYVHDAAELWNKGMQELEHTLSKLA